MKASGILSMSDDDDIGRRVIPTNKLGPQDQKILFYFGNNGMNSDVHTIKG